MPSERNARQTWADAVKGIATSAVILIHVVISLWDTGNIFRSKFSELLIIHFRTFVIPVFFYSSGIFVARRLIGKMHVFYRNWLLAVVWPYLLWGMVVVVAEQLLRGVRNPVDTSPIDITLLWTPIAWLWFLYVFAIFQLLAVACRRAPNVLVGLGAAGVLADALWPLPVLLHLCCYFLIFYAVGVAYGPRLLTWRISPTLGLSALIASVPLALVAIPNIAHLWTWPGLPAALAGVVGIWSGYAGSVSASRTARGSCISAVARWRSTLSTSSLFPPRASCWSRDWASPASPSFSPPALPPVLQARSPPTKSPPAWGSR